MSIEFSSLGWTILKNSQIVQKIINLLNVKLNDLLIKYGAHDPNVPNYIKTNLLQFGDLEESPCLSINSINFESSEEKINFNARASIHLKGKNKQRIHFSVDSQINPLVSSKGASGAMARSMLGCLASDLEFRFELPLNFSDLNFKCDIHIQAEASNKLKPSQSLSSSSPSEPHMNEFHYSSKGSSIPSLLVSRMNNKPQEKEEPKEINELDQTDHSKSVGREPAKVDNKNKSLSGLSSFSPIPLSGWRLNIFIPGDPPPSFSISVETGLDSCSAGLKISKTINKQINTFLNQITHKHITIDI